MSGPGPGPAWPWSAQPRLIALLDDAAEEGGLRVAEAEDGEGIAGFAWMSDSCSCRDPVSVAVCAATMGPVLCAAAAGWPR